MTTLDIILIIPLIYALYSGFKNGFFAQLGGIVAIVLGIWLAVRNSERVGALMGFDPEIAYYAAFVLILVVCFIVIGIVGWMLGKVFHLVGLGLLNRIGGVVLALVKTVLILGALLMAFNAINKHAHIVSQQQFQGSLLYGPIVRTTNYALPFLKKAVDAIDFTNGD